VAKPAGIAEPGIDALEMLYEGVSKLSPAVDPPPRKVLKPGTCRAGKVQPNALDDEQILVDPPLW
jgi:hypothetical protein